MKEKIRSFFQSIKSNNDNKQGSKKIKYLIVIGLIGLLLIILGNTFTSTPKEVKQNSFKKGSEENAIEEVVSKEVSAESEVGELEASYEKDLQAMLNKIKGVSEVEVMVNIDSTNVKIYEKNLIKGQQTTDESDKNGGIRKVEDETEETQVVLVRQGDQEVPLLIQTKKPNVRGVFIVAKGADHATVKMWIVETTSKVLDVPTHRVSVMPKN